MNIEGWRPTAECGRYFGASRRTWIAFFIGIRELCGDLIDAPLLFAMAEGEGAGPRDQATCTEMARRFEAHLAANPNGLEFVNPADDAKDSESKETFRASEEFVDRWIQFLLSCGGFEVWT